MRAAGRKVARLGIARLGITRPGIARLAAPCLAIQPQHASRGFALQRRVSKEGLAVDPQHEVDEPVAEAAHAIEKQDGFPVFRIAMGGLVHRAQVLFSRTDWVS